jgi:hypothetical protein
MHLFLEREIPFVSYNTSQPENLAYAICNGCAIKKLEKATTDTEGVKL